jgi:hypothetical protein
MPVLPLALAAFVLALAAGTADAATPQPLAPAADAPDLKGNWKLVVLAFGDDEFAIIGIDTKNGEPTAEITNFQRLVMPGAKVDRVEQKGDKLTIDFRMPDGVHTFAGRLVNEGPHKGQLLGSMYYRETLYPARMEKTDADEVKPFGRRMLSEKLGPVTRLPEGEGRIEKLKELTKAYAETPANYSAYNALIQSAVKQEKPEAEVREHIDAWMKGAQVYGDDWTSEVRMKLLRALSGKKPYVALALEQATHPT